MKTEGRRSDVAALFLWRSGADTTNKQAGAREASGHLGTKVCAASGVQSAPPASQSAPRL